jgi:hypothetical protein
MCGNLTYEDIHLKGDTIASVKELKDEKTPKAKQILLGADTHLRGYQVGRKIDDAAVGVVENFRSEEALTALANHV